MGPHASRGIDFHEPCNCRGSGKSVYLAVGRDGLGIKLSNEQLFCGFVFGVRVTASIEH